VTKRTVWNYEDVFGRGSPESRLFLITDQFRRLLLQATDRFFWESAWTEELDDSEWAVIDDGVRTLMDEEMITVTVTPQITINNNSAGGDGCSTPPPWSDIPGECYPVDEYPADDIPNQPPTRPDEVPAEEWDEYRCKLANYAWEKVDAWLEKLAGASKNLFAIASVLFLLWSILPGALLAIIGGTILSLASAMVAWSAYAEALDEFFDRALVYWRDNREELVCKFYNATNATALREGILSEMLTAVIDWMEARPYWFTQMGDMVSEVGSRLFPIQLFTLPWRLVPPANYVGVIDCTCTEGGSGSVPVPIDDGAEWRAVLGVRLICSCGGCGAGRERRDRPRSSRGGGCGGDHHASGTGCLGSLWYDPRCRRSCLPTSGDGSLWRSPHCA